MVHEFLWFPLQLFKIASGIFHLRKNKNRTGDNAVDLDKWERICMRRTQHDHKITPVFHIAPEHEFRDLPRANVWGTILCIYDNRSYYKNE